MTSKQYMYIGTYGGEAVYSGTSEGFALRHRGPCLLCIYCDQSVGSSFIRSSLEVLVAISARRVGGGGIKDVARGKTEPDIW